VRKYNRYSNPNNARQVEKSLFLQATSANQVEDSQPENQVYLNKTKNKYMQVQNYLTQSTSCNANAVTQMRSKLQPGTELK